MNVSSWGQEVPRPAPTSTAQRNAELDTLNAAQRSAGPGARHAEMPDGGGFHAVFSPDRVVLVYTRSGRTDMLAMAPSDWDRLVRWAPKLRGLAR